MNSSKFFIFYISLFCSHYVANVQSANEKALTFDVKNEKLIEFEEKNEASKCTLCITACAASSDSQKEQQINNDAAIAGNAIFLKEVYENDGDEGKTIKTGICKEPLNPSIVWDHFNSIFKIGYEMFYDVEKVELPSSSYEYGVGKVIQGEPDTEWKKLTVNEFMETFYDSHRNLRFYLPGSRELLGYYWIEVLAIDAFKNLNRRMVTFTKDTFNDFFHKNGQMSHCEMA